MSRTSELFKRATELPEGKTLILNFADRKALLSSRALLFREKRKYKRRLLTAYEKEVVIRYEISDKDKSYRLLLSKVDKTEKRSDGPRLQNAVVVDEEGNESPIEGLVIETPEKEVQLSPEGNRGTLDARIKRLQQKELEGQKNG